MSDDPFSKYAAEIEKMKVATQGANNCCGQLARIFSPLFQQQNIAGTAGEWSWRGHYLTGLPDQTAIPASLVRRGGPGAPKQPIDVSGVMGMLTQLQQFIALHEEALEAAQQAYNAIPQAQRALMTAPPWRF